MPAGKRIIQTGSNVQLPGCLAGGTEAIDRPSYEDGLTTTGSCVLANGYHSAWSTLLLLVTACASGLASRSPRRAGRKRRFPQFLMPAESTFCDSFVIYRRTGLSRIHAPASFQARSLLWGALRFRVENRWRFRRSHGPVAEPLAIKLACI